MQTPKLVRYSMRTIIKLAVAAGLFVALRSPASAGQSVCMWIGSADSGNGNIKAQQNCGVTGTYHVDVWGAGHPRTHSRDYRYTGVVAINHIFNWRIPSGAQVCGELWYHKPGGGYESKGLPCWTRP
ncbi:MAG TPA: hypothetical protein VGK64_10385 [Bryobacteraceae bacterium]